MLQVGRAERKSDGKVMLRFQTGLFSPTPHLQVGSQTEIPAWNKLKGLAEVAGLWGNPEGDPAWPRRRKP